MGLTPRGIQYPDASTPMSILGIAQALAATADTAVTALETSLKTWVAGRSRAGTASVTLTAASTGTVNVTFSTPFTTAPRVTATAMNSLYNVAVESTTITGCVLRVRHINDATATATVNAQWIAVVAS